MKTRIGSLAALLAIICLTICQFTVAEAQTGRKRTAKRQAKRVVKVSMMEPRKATRQKVRIEENEPVEVADEMDEEFEDLSSRSNSKAPEETFDDAREIDAATSRLGTTARFAVPSGNWLTSDQFILNPIPSARMFVMSASLNGSTTQMEMTATSTYPTTNGTKYNVNSNGSSFGPDIAMLYGLTDHFYFGFSASYAPGRTETETTLPVSSPYYGYFGATNPKSILISDGWNEPSLKLGASLKIGTQTRLSGSLSGRVPVGSARSEIRGNETRTNGLTGGGSIGPVVTASTRISIMKTYASYSYMHELERKTEVSSAATASSFASSYEEVKTGGDNHSAVLGVEFPTLYNIGLAGRYSRDESSSTKRSDNGQTTSNAAQQSGAAMAYMGLELSEMNSILIPRIARVMFVEADGVSVNRMEAWTFTLQGVLHF